MVPWRVGLKREGRKPRPSDYVYGSSVCYVRHGHRFYWFYCDPVQTSLSRARTDHTKNDQRRELVKLQNQVARFMQRRGCHDFLQCTLRVQLPLSCLLEHHVAAYSAVLFRKTLASSTRWWVNLSCLMVDEASAGAVEPSRAKESKGNGKLVLVLDYSESFFLLVPNHDWALPFLSPS